MSRVRIIKKEDGSYDLLVDEICHVKLKKVWDQPQCLWMVHGPADLDTSIQLMRGFIHLTAIMAQQFPGFIDRPPLTSEVPIESEGSYHHEQHQERSGRHRTAEGPTGKVRRRRSQVR